MTATKEELLVPLQWMSKQRLLLILQTIWIIMRPRGMNRLENPVFMYRDHPPRHHSLVLEILTRSLHQPCRTDESLRKDHGSGKSELRSRRLRRSYGRGCAKSGTTASDAVLQDHHPEDTVRKQPLVAGWYPPNKHSFSSSLFETRTIDLLTAS
ncbi:hypothetical protein CEXT_416231 [Caerostris extrusa]|uniref:Uncharacterized protein n=1 Tax=Caerostris extrusa TaxID=172846 RepID=A0AAV4MU28_CAEEX|nr:hypothetical protein CEXT_416231 [Caerostris extrusa]